MTAWSKYLLSHLRVEGSIPRHERLIVKAFELGEITAPVRLYMIDVTKQVSSLDENECL